MKNYKLLCVLVLNNFYKNILLNRTKQEITVLILIIKKYFPITHEKFEKNDNEIL